MRSAQCQSSQQRQGPGTASAAQNVGPIAGALIAVAFAFILRGRGGDPISRAAGSGVLTPGRGQERKRLSHAIERGEVTPPPTGPSDSPS